MKWWLKKHFSVGLACQLLKLDASALQVLPQSHPPLEWQVLDGMLHAYVRGSDTEGEGVDRQSEEGSIWRLASYSRLPLRNGR